MTVTLGLAAARTASGVPLDIVMDDAPPVLAVCLAVGFFVLVFANLASDGLVQLAIWWRRR